ncbi:MAG: SPOR domain-containing protein [Muribaculaceae bacterium]|nr:SPOR domain-containing protein [Muribaculaceae bacterium]
MRNFSFSQSDYNEEQDIEKILRQRKRKIYKQQLLYTIILAIIIFFICVWLYRKSVYVEFDGYVSVDDYTFRTDDDVFYLNSKWRVGDLLVPGDTVFSYVLAGNFYKHESNDYEPTIIVRDRDMNLQYGVARQDLNVLQVRINELERQLQVQDHNIRLGLSDNHNKLRTEQELSEAREQYKALRRKLGVMWGAMSQSKEAVSRLTNHGYGYLRVSEMRNVKLLDSLGLVRYAIAADSSIVTEKHVPTYSLVLRGEPILTSQGLNLANNNVSVMAYVKPDQMKYVTYHTKATVIVTDEVRYTASVMMLGARTEAIPGELRSTLSRDHTASIVAFHIDPDQNVPFWSLINKLPVTLRINKFREGTGKVDDYIVFNTTYGIDPLSMKRWHDNKLTMQEWAEDSVADTAAVVVNPFADTSALSGQVNKPANNRTFTPKTSVGTTKPAQKAQTQPKPQQPQAAPARPQAKPAAPQAKPAPAVPADVRNAAAGSYHVIVGSGAKRDGAERFVQTLHKAGYTGARVLEMDGTFRIAIASYPTREAAEAGVAAVKKDTEFKTAWVKYQKLSKD